MEQTQPAESQTPVIELRNVSKTFGEVRSLAGLAKRLPPSAKLSPAPRVSSDDMVAVAEIEITEDSEIRDIAANAGAAEACESLVQLAKQRGGFDNITVAIASLEATDRSVGKVAPPTREVEVQS